MNLKVILITMSLMVAGALLIFQIFQRQFSGGLLNVMLDPEIRDFLSEAMEDQRKLAELDVENTAEYREQFAKIKQMRDNYYILEVNREEISQRFELALSGMLAAILLFTGGFFIWSRWRQERRLIVMQTHLEALSAGKTDIEVGDSGSDVLGRISRMIEKASGVMARQRRRLENMESLSAWQEAARRHAHEIRTPLTAAQMELNTMTSFVCKRSPELSERVRYMQESVTEELDRLKDFTQQFTSFAKIGKPKLKQVDVWTMLARYCELFSEAWNNLELSLVGKDGDYTLEMDKDMTRQVLVNLCNNSSLAIGEGRGRVSLSVSKDLHNLNIYVADSGPGISEEVLPKLFKPYTTSRKIGEGMGLGLSIAKKIMLDHGGDLLLHKTSEEGTTFRLLFPLQAEGVA